MTEQNKIKKMSERKISRCISECLLNLSGIVIDGMACFSQMIESRYILKNLIWGRTWTQWCELDDGWLGSDSSYNKNLGFLREWKWNIWLSFLGGKPNCLLPIVRIINICCYKWTLSTDANNIHVHTFLPLNQNITFGCEKRLET